MPTKKLKKEYQLTFYCSFIKKCLLQLYQLRINIIWQHWRRDEKEKQKAEKGGGGEDAKEYRLQLSAFSVTHFVAFTSTWIEE